MMRKTYLGRTGLEISEIAFGGGVTGGILINPDEATRYTALRRAVMSGINWIDIRGDLPRTATGKIQRFKLRD